MTAKLSWEEAVYWLRSQPDQSELVRACFYDDPLCAAAQRYHASSEWEAVRELLPKVTGKALDLGAGRGISAYALARDGWQICALEPDPSDLVGAGAIRKLAHDTKLDIHVEQSWGETLPFPDETFDLVHGRQVLHHARDLNQLCQEAARVLRPGGAVIFTREHVLTKTSDLSQFLSSHPLHSLYGGEHAYLLNDYLHAMKINGIVLSRVLNPYQSNINLFPETLVSLRRRLSAKFNLPEKMMPNFLMSLLGAMSNAPGRLYTFVGNKNA